MCDFTGFARASVQVLEDYAPNTYTAAFAMSKPWAQAHWTCATDDSVTIVGVTNPVLPLKFRMDRLPVYRVQTCSFL